VFRNTYLKKDKVNTAVHHKGQWDTSGVLISLSMAVEPIGG